MKQREDVVTAEPAEGVMPSGWERRRSRVALHVERTALELLATRGDTLTIEDIANAAGLSRRTFYRYFDSIDDILRAPLRRYVDIWAQAFREQPLEASLITTFHAASMRTLETLSNPEELGFALTIMGRDSDVSTRIRAETQRYCSDIYFDLIAQRSAVRGGDINAARAVSAAFAALMFQVAEDCMSHQQPLNPDCFTAALTLLAQLLGDVMPL